MTDAFTTRLNGSFRGILRWPELDTLWATVRGQPDGWYASLTGEAVPNAPLAADALGRFIDELDALLRREHDYDYCGIVYTDDPAQPTFIKVYDPHNLGSSCGCGHTRYLPRWVLSRVPPTAITDNAPLPGARRRWWQRLFG